MNKSMVLISNPMVPDSGINLLKENGYKVVIVDKDDRAEILQKVQGVEALWWASKSKLDSAIIDAAGPQLKIVGVMAAGYNHIDIRELQTRSIKATNTPGVLSEAVADVAVLLTLAAARRLREGQLAIAENQWPSVYSCRWMSGRDITNSTIGVIGLGGIGQEIVKRFKGFNVKEFLYTGYKEKKEGVELGAKFVSLNALLEASDFVIVAVPLTSKTEGMCNEEFFSKMKNTAVFVNISRGTVVDQPALITALKKGKIFGAGLDVMTPEPLPSNHELAKLPNVVLLPHIGSATVDTREAMSTLTAQNIIRGLNNQELLTPIY